MLKKCRQLKSKRSAIAIASAIPLILFSQSSFAWGISIDPPEIAQSTITAAKQVASYAKMLQDRITQLQQYETQLENLEQLPGEELDKILAPVRSVEGSISQFQNEEAELKDMEVQLSNQGSDLNNMYQGYVASGLTNEDYQNAFAQMMDGGNNNAIQEYQNYKFSVGALANDNQTLQKEDAAIPTTVGAANQAELMESELSQVIKQGQQMISNQNTALANNLEKNRIKLAKEKNINTESAGEQASFDANAIALNNESKSLSKSDSDIPSAITNMESSLDSGNN